MERVRNKTQGQGNKNLKYAVPTLLVEDCHVGMMVIIISGVAMHRKTVSKTLPKTKNLNIKHADACPYAG